MSIILVGGHERMEEDYREIGSTKGHRVKVYTKMTTRFDKTIGSPDGIILFTNTVSHKMVLTAIKEAKRKNIPVIRCHSSSKEALNGAINQLENTVDKA